MSSATEAARGPIKKNSHTINRALELLNKHLLHYLNVLQATSLPPMVYKTFLRTMALDGLQKVAHTHTHTPEGLLAAASSQGLTPRPRFAKSSG